MAQFYCYEGLEKAFTFKVDSTTSTAVAADPKELVGKAIAMTGDYTVGYGTSGDAIMGFVEQVEIASTNDKTLLVSVRRFRMFEGVSCAGTETAGDFLTVDGSGGVAKATVSTTAIAPTNAIAIGVNATDKTCTVLVL